MAGPQTPFHGFQGCDDADFDGDNDVDQADFGIAQRCLSGFNVPVEVYCMEPASD